MSSHPCKNIHVGPIRFNISNFSIGISGGTKWFRSVTKPSGTYVRMGENGVYYRKTSSGNSVTQKRTTRKVNAVSPHTDQFSYASSFQMRDIESADVANMTDSSSEELLAEINRKMAIPRIGPWILGVALLLLGFLAAAKITLIWIALCAVLSAYAIYLAFNIDAVKKSIVMLYDFDPAFEKFYVHFHASALRLAACSGCWHVSAAGRVADRKYNAGASTVVERKRTVIAPTSPRFIKTNINTIAINVGRQTLHFFPDRLLVFDEGRIGAVDYANLQTHVSQTRFVENTTAPSDARVVDTTWKYVNKKGGPDRRFSHNPQLPICLYDELHFQSRTGLNELIQLSRCGVSEAFVGALQTLAEYTVS